MADLDDYAKADDATEFGYLHGTTGKPVVGKPHHACHSDVAKTMGYKETDDHTADQTAQKAGHVRYAIAPNGKAAFTYHSNTNPEAHKHIAKFVQKNPHIFNKVAVERMDKDSTGLTQSHMYDFKDSRDTANTLKNLVKEQSYTTFLNKLLREHDEEDHEYPQDSESC